MKGSRTVIGILAHVDAGKTTLSEGLLYTAGMLRRLGRVDHGDAFLDNFALERERGITIFSKQANLSWKGLELVLLDTPGHVDFSAETERTLQILDYCLLVISGSDGVQGHTETIWRLLKRYGIPVFLFINKMDQPGTDRQTLLKELQGRLGDGCVDFGGGPEAMEDPAWREILAMESEELMEEYLETGTLRDGSVAGAIAKRQIFPCYFGSALRLEGVEELLDGLRRFTLAKEYPEEFGARVYKISRDATGNRLTHLKVTGGELRVKMPVSNRANASGEEDFWEEKADVLRIYGGGNFQAADRVAAGGVCAVTGLSRTYAGQGLGCEGAGGQPVLAPVLTYRLTLPPGTDMVKALGQMRSLEEEEPELHVVWHESVRELQVQVMGEVQIEVLKRLILERFGMEAEFDSGRLLYKETIASSAEGIGHFEPLRHYAEVHLLLEPGEPGSGLEFAVSCSEDELDRNWQRLVLTHLEEKTHLGVLTGSPITDMKITLLTGRAHLKHTEGGDFRQATYRALRQGLMQCESILLEPVFSYVLEIPLEQLGRAMSDIQRMQGSFAPPVTSGETAVLTGSAPVSSMRDYQREVNAYTRGRGRLSCALKGYEPCHNAAEVIAEIGYDAESDTENPASSVFCAHGAGFLVGWEEVPAYAHVESGWSPEQPGDRCPCPDSPEGEMPVKAARGIQGGERPRKGSSRISQTGSGSQERSDYITQEEIEEIFQRTYGKSAQSYTPYRYYQQNTGGAGRADTREPEGGGSIEATGSKNGGKDPGNGGGNDFGSNSRNNPGNGGNDSGSNSRNNPGNGRNDSRGNSENNPGSNGGKYGMGKRAAGKCAVGGQEEASQEVFLVDGYNIIFAWDELRALAEKNIDSARDSLTDICCNFQGYQGAILILVFDAYKVRGNPGSVQKYHNIYVVYTKEAETADQYIEKTVHKIGKKYRVTVATSDALEQIIIWGDGAIRLSARGFYEAVEAAGRRMREEHPGGGRLSHTIPVPPHVTV